MKIILATTSPYRKEIFGYLGLDFICEGSKVDERFEKRPTNPRELVFLLARMKAETVAKNHKEGIVIGFDSAGWFDGKIMENPRTEMKPLNG